MYDKTEIASHVLSQLQSIDNIFDSVSSEAAVSYVEYAESDIALYLNIKTPLPDEFVSKLKELTKLKLMSEYSASNQLKSRSYQEGDISESETYLTADDIKSQENALLSSLNAYRRCRIVT